MKYKFLSHTADIKFKAFGNSIEEVYENSALALTNIMHKGNVKPKKRKKIIITGHDKENLLYEFLEEFLFFGTERGTSRQICENKAKTKSKKTCLKKDCIY